MTDDVEVLFRELAGLPQGAREEYYLSRGTPTDVRAEVESLLRFDGTLGQSAPECVSGVAEDLLRSGSAVPGNRRCGPYRLVSLLGRGGAGAVYLGERADGELEQRVAIKLLRFGSDEPAFRARFLRERQILASLSHPGIARLLDAGHTDDGQPYLVMEYIAGTPIDVHAEALDFRAKLRLFLGVCQAVSHAHRHLIIHRDIKPGNILVDAEGQPRLLDFGIAKMLDAAADQTRTQERLLTPDYASPEQVRGGSQGPATDIYSLGAVLYKLLTGCSPRSAGSESAGLSHPPAARALNPGVPLDLDFIVAKALREEPRERYSSVDALENDLRAFLDSRPLHARSHDAWYRARKFVSRYWTRACVAAALALVLTAGLVFSRHTEPQENSVPIPVTSFPGFEDAAAWSPDGREVAFTWNGDKQDNFDIYVIKPGTSEIRRLTTDPGNDAVPVWSPDGRWILYVHKPADNGRHSLELISPDGRVSRTLFTSPYPFGRSSWALGGSAVVFAMKPGPNEPFALYSMSLDSGSPRQLTWPPADIQGDIAVAVSPDSKTAAIERKTGWRTSELYLLPLHPNLTPSGVPRCVTSAGYATAPAWTPDGSRILFEMHREGVGIWQMNRTGGNQRPVFGIPSGASAPAVTRRFDGRLSVVFTNIVSQREIWRYPIGHKRASPVELVSSSRSQAYPQYSNDGRKLAFSSNRSGYQEIWVANSDGSQPVQLTDLHHQVTDTGQWSPSDDAIAFASQDRGRREVYILPVSGGPPVLITPGEDATLGGGWTADGTAYYCTLKRGGRWEVWRVGRRGEAPLLLTPNGGFGGFESRHGTFYYWQAGHDYTATLWQRTPNGDQRVNLDPPSDGGGMVSAGAHGFYYRAADTQRIYLYDETARRSSPISIHKLAPHLGGFTISPDARWLAAEFIVSDSRDLMIMEDFH